MMLRCNTAHREQVSNTHTHTKNKTIRPSSAHSCLCPQCLYGDVEPLANHTLPKALACRHTLSKTTSKKNQWNELGMTVQYLRKLATKLLKCLWRTSLTMWTSMSIQTKSYWKKPFTLAENSPNTLDEYWLRNYSFKNWELHCVMLKTVLKTSDSGRVFCSNTTIVLCSWMQNRVLCVR